MVWPFAVCFMSIIFFPFKRSYREIKGICIKALFELNFLISKKSLKINGILILNSKNGFIPDSVSRFFGMTFETVGAVSFFYVWYLLSQLNTPLPYKDGSWYE